MTDEQVFAVKDPVVEDYDPTVAVPPEPATQVAARYRCTACGNLTRFDVTSTRRSRAFHHYTVGGDLEVEDVEILDEQVESVVCHWCGTGDAVVDLDDADAGSQAGADG